MIEEIIEYKNLNDYKPKEKINSLIIKDVPQNELISVEELYHLSLDIIENGSLKLIYSSKLSDEFISKIKSNLIFSGLINISSEIKESTEITCIKKDWPNNLVNEFKDLDAKNINKDNNPGVDESHLIDPYTTYKPKLKYIPPCNAKPCANCVCGRAAALKNKENIINEKKIEIKDNKGGCGRCHLGDEFRCANCPYRGMPAFDKKLMKNSDEKEENQEIEKIKLNIENKVVKIDV